MNDRQIRSALHDQALKTAHRRIDCRVVDEMGLKHGARRADVAVIGPQIMQGYEIKSDEDRLARLPAQVAAYSAVFDKATIVVTERHLQKAVGMVPRWWGVLFCRGTDPILELRPARPNPGGDPLSVAQLLWKTEVSELLRQRGEPPKVLRSVRALQYQRLVDLTEPEELGRLVRTQLMARERWR
jgi:hypothetical protein